MHIKQSLCRHPGELPQALATLQEIDADLVLVFGAVDHLADPAFYPTLRSTFPSAHLLGCSTAGEITRDGVIDGCCTVTAIDLAATPLYAAQTTLDSMADSRAAGERVGQQLSEQLAGARPRAVIVLGPGVEINGSALVEGIASQVGDDIPMTGGLGGDGGAFRQTWTLGDQGVGDRQIVAVALAGDALCFGHGSFGGWQPFGPARKVTRCENNVLFELDGEPALAIYKRYLGEHASKLPASGLLFPLAMLGEDHSAIGLIRTILGVDETTGSITLAGEIDPQGYLKLMHASTDKLVEGATSAAEAAAAMAAADGDSLALLVSCVGRKLVMGNRVDEEVEAVGAVLGQGAMLTGFYSYGEISPFTPGVSCKLHNQTMTISWLGENPAPA